jgi:hypothetical protein
MNDYVNIQFGGGASPMYLAKYFFPYVWFIFEKINNLENKTKRVYYLY